MWFPDKDSTDRNRIRMVQAMVTVAAAGKKGKKVSFNTAVINNGIKELQRAGGFPSYYRKEIEDVIATAVKARNEGKVVQLATTKYPSLA